MKKLLVLLVAFIMLFALVACDDEKPCEVHVDADGNEICDNCQAVVINPNKPSILGPAIAQGLENQFKEIASGKLTIEMTKAEKYEEWENSDDETPVPELNKEYDEVKSVTEIVFSKTEDGFNLKVTEKNSKRDSETGEFTTVEDAPMYVIGNATYIYMESYGLYQKTLADTATLEEIESTIALLTEGVEISDEKKLEAKAMLGEKLVEVFDIKNNKGSASIDLEDEANELIAYIENLDLEEDTVRKVLDDALKNINEELTVEAILTEVERISALTVEEAIAEIDAFLTEKYETTLQGIFDKIVADKNAETIIKNALKMMMAQSEEGMSEEQLAAAVDEAFAEIKAFKIADAIVEAGIAEAVVFDLVIAIVSEGETEGAPTSEQLFAMINSFVDMTLAEFEEGMEMPIFTIAKEVASGMKVNKLNAKLDINFSGILGLESVILTANADIEKTAPSEIEGKTNFMSVALTANVTLSDLSKEEAQMVAPENFYLGILSTNFYSENYNRLYITPVSTADGTSVYAQVRFFYETEDATYEFVTDTSLDKLSSERLVFKAQDVDEINGAEFVGTEDIVIELDISEREYRVVSIPELVFPE